MSRFRRCRRCRRIFLVVCSSEGIEGCEGGRKEGREERANVSFILQTAKPAKIPVFLNCVMSHGFLCWEPYVLVEDCAAAFVHLLGNRFSLLYSLGRLKLGSSKAQPPG
jgi:hypothetical protein